MEIKNVSFVSENELKKYKNDLYNEILNDKEFYKTCLLSSFNNEEIYANISLFDERRKNFNLVKNIKSYEECVKYNTYEKMVLVREGKFIEREYEVLPFVLSNIQYNSRFIEKDFDDDLNNVQLGDVDGDKLKKEVKKNLKKDKVLYLYGANRTGKTYLSIAIVNNYIKNQNGNIAFLNVNKRFLELNNLLFSRYDGDKKDFNELMNEYSTCNVLVLDGLGSEKKNEWIRDSILIPILKERNERKLFTIITSNYTIDELVILYSFNKKDGEIMAKSIKNIINSQLTNIINFGETPKLY